MGFDRLALALFLLHFASLGCAEGTTPVGDGGGSEGGGSPSDGGGGRDGGGGEGGGVSCGDMCDEDEDGVVDGSDECPDTPAGEPVNSVGCAASQLEPTLQDMWPPYGLTWTEAGDIGRAGGLTWTYAGIDHGELFHIYWIPCDDPETTCGVSLDGPIDAPGEAWIFSAAQSAPANGSLVFTNTTNIALADATSPSRNGRLTVTIAGPNAEVVPFADVETLGITARDGSYGAEITGEGFTVTIIIEVEDPAGVWTPYLDYHDAAPTPDPGPGTTVSFGGSFYDE